jgi:hypothetical protein
MKIQTLLVAAILAAGFSAAQAQGLLDDQLGPKPPTPATAPATQAALKPEAKPETPKPGGGGGDIISPDAAKKVDDDELLKQLLDPSAKPDPDAVKQRLKDMVTRMDDATKLLSDKKDPGDVTQETQRRIVADLDVMIELARQQQQQQSSSSSSSQQPQPGQPRQPQPGQPQQGPKGEGGSQAATNEQLPRGGYADPTRADMRNRDPANWGGLPPRDRDQISAGANEEALAAYKDMIDRYYQALAEMGRTRSH